MDEQRTLQQRATMLETRLWREVARHLELDESLRLIAPLVCEVVPIDLLAVRRLEREPVRLTTVALAGGDGAVIDDVHPARTELGEDSLGAIEHVLRTGRAVLLADSGSPSPLRPLVPGNHAGTAIAGPLSAHGEPAGVLVLLAKPGAVLGREHLDLVDRLIEPLGVALENDRRLLELARMREALEADRRALLTRLNRQDIADPIVGSSTGLNGVMERCEQVAKTDAPVLILGETGSGKEMIARTIHGKSRRGAGPIVRINCGAIPPELVDSELFGHERGSFTGAVSMRKGWFERADGGTLFLDEIGELPMAAQVRLLRVLQDGTLERVGGHQPITVDVRIVAATHRKLEQMVAEGSFREDLWYRISVFPIRLPALRERMEDIPELARHFARRAGQRLGGMSLAPTGYDLELLARYDWPGNVRELQAVIERAAILGDGKRLEIGKSIGTLEPSAATSRGVSTPAPAPSATAGSGSESSARLEDAMRGHIEQALAATQGRIEGPFGAARRLGINPHTLRARMRKLGIDWARFRGAGDAK
jgi:hydrogenase-4 transcriptional activator